LQLQVYSIPSKEGQQIVDAVTKAAQALGKAMRDQARRQAGGGGGGGGGGGTAEGSIAEVDEDELSTSSSEEDDFDVTRSGGGGAGGKKKDKKGKKNKKKKKREAVAGKANALLEKVELVEVEKSDSARTFLEDSLGHQALFEVSVRKRTALFGPHVLMLKTDHFTKTGSGQTLGRHSKRPVFW
jgi:hypothetical protein